MPLFYRFLSELAELPFRVVDRVSAIRAAAASADALFSALPLPFGVSFRREEIGGVPALIFEPPSYSCGRTVIHFPGGGFVSQTPDVHAHFCARLCKESGLSVYLPLLPLSPEATFFARQEAGLSFVRELRRIHPVHSCVFGGDGTGASFVLSLVSEYLSSPFRPARVYAVSPHFDFSKEGNGVYALLSDDDSVPRRVDPRISPFFSLKLGELPPTLFILSGGESESTETRDFLRKTIEAGAPIHSSVFPGTTRDFVLLPLFPSASDAVSEIALFCRLDEQDGCDAEYVARPV